MKKEASAQEGYIQQAWRRLAPGLRDYTTPKDIKDAVEAYGDLLKRGDEYDPNTIPALIALLGRRKARQPEKAKADEQDTKTIDTYDTLLTSDYLAYLLRQWVREIRIRNCHSEHAPFKSYGDALNWMESQSTELTPELMERYPRAHLNMLPLYRTKEGQLAYINPNPRAKELMDILTESHKMKEKTGLGTISLMMYILADIKPLLPSYEWSAYALHQELSTEEGLVSYKKSEMTVKIKSAMSWKDMLTLYELMRTHFGAKKRKELNEKHLELYHIVQGRGGPVKGKGAKGFWESIQKELNYDSWNSWEAAKIAYYRIVKNLEDRFQVKKRA